MPIIKPAQTVEIRFSDEKRKEIIKLLEEASVDGYSVEVLNGSISVSRSQADPGICWIIVRTEDEYT